MPSVNLCHHVFHPFSQNGIHLTDTQKTNAKMGLILCALFVVPGLVAFSSIALWYKYKNLNTAYKQSNSSSSDDLSPAVKTYNVFHKKPVPAAPPKGDPAPPKSNPAPKTVDNVPIAFTIHNEKKFRSRKDAAKYVLSHGSFQRSKKGVIGVPDGKLRRLIRYATNQFPDCMAPDMLKKYRNENPEVALIMQMKRIGHVFALKDSVALPGGDFLKFEGLTPHLTTAMLSATLSSFYTDLDDENRPDWFTPDRFSWIQNSLTNLLFSNVVDENELHFIGEELRQDDFHGSVASASGFSTHTTVTGFIGRIGYILNTGAHANPSGGTVYLVPLRSLITDNALEDIIRSGNVKEEDCFGHNAMVSELGGKVLTTFKLPPQESGNCTYKSLEAYIFMLFAIQYLHAKDPDNFEKNLENKEEMQKAFTAIRPLFNAFVYYDRQLIYDDLRQDSETPGETQPLYQMVLNLVEESKAFKEMISYGDD